MAEIVEKQVIVTPAAVPAAEADAAAPDVEEKSGWKHSQASGVGGAPIEPPRTPKDESRKKSKSVKRTKSAKNIPLAPPPPPEEIVLTYDNLKASIPWETVYMSEEREKDPCQDLVSFPEDDLKIVTFPKVHRTEMEAKPPGDDAELDPYVKISLQCFSADWKLVMYQYTRYNNHKFDKSVYDLETPKYQVTDLAVAPEMEAMKSRGGVANEKGHRNRSVSTKQKIMTADVGLSEDDPHFSYAKPVTKRTLAKNKKARTVDRLQWFQYYDPEYDWQPGSEVALCHRIRKTQAPNTKTQAQHFRPFFFTVKANHIAFQLGNFEPFFARMKVVDLKTKSVLSETFHFHTNEDVILQKVGRAPGMNAKDPCAIKQALFSVTRRHADIYLFLHVEKVLHGDGDASVDPYAKIKALVKQKDQLKCQNRIKNEVDEYCSKMGRYRQPFGWSAIQLFDPKGNLNVNGDCLFESIYSYVNDKEDIFAQLNLLADVKKGTVDAKKLGKNLNGFCSITLNKVEETDIPTFKLIDPSLQEVKGEPGPDAVALREVYEFPQMASMTPNFYYVNNMYIYPEFVNLSKTAKGNSNVFIKMQVKCDDLMGIDEPGLMCIYSPSMPTGFVDEVITSVHYRNKSPNFSEEFKIALPPHLTANHHLLFTFYNVNMGKGGHKGEQEVIGHSVVPLYPDNRIVVHNQETHHMVPTIPKLDQAYMNFWDQYCLDTKANFQLRFKLVSTIYPEDASITRFLNIYHTTEDEVPDEQLIETLQGLKNLTKELATQYLPVIINNLLEVMCNRKGHKPKLESFKSLVGVLHKVSSGGSVGLAMPRNELLELYSTYIFDQTFGTHKTVYQTLCSNFLLYMMEKKMEGLQNTKDTESSFGNSWFIFDLIIKSMVLQLSKEGMVNADRTGVFDDNFTRVLSKLLNAVTKYFGNRLFGDNVDMEMEDIRLLNKNLALFIKDLLGIFDRGIVFDMIRQYLTEMKDLLMISKLELTAKLRFEFLRIVCDHEHFIPLNLPFGYEDMSLSSLSQKHPMATIMIYEVVETLKSANQKACSIAIGSLYDIICRTAFDERYQTDERRERVANVYLLLLHLMISQHHSISPWFSEATIADRRELYSCVLYIFRTCNRKMLRKWWCSESARNQTIFLQILVSAVKTFEFDPALTRPTKSLLTPQVALFMKQVGTPEMTELLKGLARQLNAEERANFEEKRLRQLTAEAHTLVLDVLEDFLEDNSHDLADHTVKSAVMEHVIKLLATLLKVRQSEPVTHLVYASVRAFCHRFKETLFLGDNNFIAKIIKQVLIHLNFREASINIEASTLLFVILKLNHRVSGHFGRSRIQTVTSLSKLVASGRISEDIALSEAFSRLSKYALYGFSTLTIRDVDPTTKSFKDDDYASKLYSHFARSVQDLSATLSAILNDTIRVNELKKNGDKESIADLFVQIADSYSNTPDLRLTWLRQLAQFQDKEQNFAEAGMCYASAACLIADYLQSFGGMDYIDKSVFASVSANIQEFADDAEDGVSLSSEFTEKGLITNVRMAINFFKQDSYYEASSQLYKILIPIYEKNNSYHQLSQAYMQLHKCWSEVEVSDESRLFGKYFRIGFYGHSFGQLNTREFVYKEPKLTHLLDISERLKTHFTTYCSVPVELMDASKFAKKKGELDPDTAYILITFVEPYIEHDESRTTFLQKNTQIAEFVYETPFTMSGKAHAENVADQYKRKTVLTVSHPFPFMSKRLPVVRARDIIVTPIENAIDSIEKRNEQITTEVSRNPVNPKTLQQVLQGSVRLQVNEGATSICKTFLSDRAYINHPRTMVDTLCQAITSFLQLCKMALAQNAGCAKTDTDRGFQVEMDIGFKQLEAEMTEILQGVVYDDPQTLSESNSEFNDGTFEDEMSHDDSDFSSSPRLSRKDTVVTRERSPSSPRSPKREDLLGSGEVTGKRGRAASSLGSSSSKRASSRTPSSRRQKTASKNLKSSAGKGIAPPAGPPPGSAKSIAPPAGPPPGKAKGIAPPAGPPPGSLVKSIAPPAGPPPGSTKGIAPPPGPPPGTAAPATPNTAAPEVRPSFSSLATPPSTRKTAPPPRAALASSVPPPVTSPPKSVLAQSAPPASLQPRSIPPPASIPATIAAPGVSPPSGSMIPPPIGAGVAPVGIPPPIAGGVPAAMVPPPISGIPPPVGVPASIAPPAGIPPPLSDSQE